jgi:4-amino-4-deoxy-L-arabinose transferase-like glycosyltransferase
MRAIKKKKRILSWGLLLILALAAFLRFYQLDLVPPSLFIDEVDVGYQAFSILKTGRDYFGNLMPIHFHSLADWRTPLYLYATVPAIAFFGLNEWGVRLPAALAGVLGVWLIYLVVEEFLGFNFLKGSEKKRSRKVPVGLGLLSAFLMAVNPWHLQYSRVAFEASLMLVVFLAGIYFFFSALKIKRTKPLFWAAVFFGLSPYVYSPAKFFTPLFLVLLFLIFKKELRLLKRRSLVISILVLLLIGLPMIKEIFWGQGGERFKILSIFTDPNLIGRALHTHYLASMASSRGFLFGVHPATIAGLFYNQLTVWIQAGLNNYLAAFSPQFLFLRGDPNPRHGLIDIGSFYWFEILLIPLGFFSFKERIKDKKIRTLFWFWLFLSPLPAAITRDGAGHGGRLFFLLPILIVFSALGLEKLIEFFPRLKFRKTLLSLTAMIILFNFSWYLFDYYFIYPLQTFSWWDYGKKEAVILAKKNKDGFDKIIFNLPQKEILQFILFYYQWDPASFQQEGLIETQFAGEGAQKLGEKYYLASFNPKLLVDKKFVQRLEPRTLFIGREEEILKGAFDQSIHLPGLRVIDCVLDPVGGPVFYLLGYD